MTKKFIIGCLFLYILYICIEYYPKGKEYYQKEKNIMKEITVL